VRVTKDGALLGNLVEGDIVGSALLLTGTSADVDAVVQEPSRVLRWDVETLERYLVANPEVRIVLQRHLARDLARKFVSYAGEKH
jgi:CRP-like cAMP-binding protein